MFLRSLYGSRMPQPLHPRVDPQASKYWEEDTASSREIERAIEEAEALDANVENNTMKMISVLMAGDELTSRRRRNVTQSPQFVAWSRIDGMALEDVDGLCVEDMSSSPINAHVSPSGLISIAAADIDEAVTNNTQNVPPVNGHLDLAFIRALRQESTDTKAENRPNVMTTALRQVIGTSLAAQTFHHEVAVDTEAEQTKESFLSVVRRHLWMLRSASFSPSTPQGEIQEDAAEGPSNMRFLSLLRRVNELRSQQVNTESWDGLPYPQIIALPTFKYQARNYHADAKQFKVGCTAVNNSVCAVCCDEFRAEEEVRALPCLHFYHRQCIDQWLMCHRQCPICKHVVTVY